MDNNIENVRSLLDLLWAKTDPYRSLLAHMIETGYCAKAYIESPAMSSLLEFMSNQWNCSHEEAIAFTAYLVAMHDIGKATPQFQMQSEEQLSRLKNTEIGQFLPETRLKPVRHEYLSGSIAKRIWKSRRVNNRVCDAYSCILSLHHQKLDSSDKRRPIVHECWQQIQNETEAVIRNIFHFDGELLIPRQYDPVCILLTGILILSDWVASSGVFDGLSVDDTDYYDKCFAIARSSVARYGLVENHRMNTVGSFHALWPQILNPRDIQRKCDELDPSAPLTVIEAPMGEGKTEAALYQAVRALLHYGKRGIYVALPTQATSNQMYGRFVSMMDNMNGGRTRLLHGTSFLMRDETESIQSEDAIEAEKWLGTSRMGLLDENGVGTVDQAMGAVLLARFSVLRLLGLSNKVLIIDELHAYDAYMSEIIESLLCWCRSLSVPVILLSATLQDSQRKRYLSCYTDSDELPLLSNSYPLITQVKDDTSIIQTEVSASMKTDYVFLAEKYGQDEERICRFALGKVSGGGCYCILTNTVKRAQEIYRKLEEIKDPDVEIMLFHARFTLGKREEIEKECLRRFGKGSGSDRPGKAVLVATQVVEQSLDIDFDGMISELAPIDLLLQRAGRVHRHRDRIRPESMRNPEIYVIMPEVDETDDLESRYGSSGYVYAPFLLSNTEKLLENGKKIQVPADVRSVIAQVYERVSEENCQAWQERAFNEQLMTANADKVAFPRPAPDYFFPTQAHPEFEDMNIDDGFDPSARAATRLGEPTFRIAFTDEEHLIAAHGGRLSKGQQKELLLSSVSLRLTPAINAGLATGDIYRIKKGALSGCYVTDANKTITIGNKKLINDPVIGTYWEG